MPERHTFVCILSLQYSLFLPVICQPIAPYLHWNLIGTSLEPDWKLIGTSLKDDYNISLLSISVLPIFSNFRQLLPHKVAQPSWHRWLAIFLRRALMLTRVAQSRIVFHLPFGTAYGILQYRTGFGANRCKTLHNRAFRHFISFGFRIVRFAAIRSPTCSARDRAKVMLFIY